MQGIQTGMVGMAVLLALVGQSHADMVFPTSYEMPNGGYLDLYYSGGGEPTTEGSYLSGGLGDLTDGVVSNDPWYAVETPANDGPFVGWQIDPTIKFHFASAQNFSTVAIHFDYSGLNGVFGPSAVVINGQTHIVDQQPFGFPPQWKFFNVNVTTDILEIKLIRSGEWIFSDEFHFTASPSEVPEPGSIVAMLSLVSFGAGAVVMRQRRAKKLAT